MASVILDFNTSHVTVYRKPKEIWQTLESISIHLMLLFIDMNLLMRSMFNYFNTSHVTVYQAKTDHKNN